MSNNSSNGPQGLLASMAFGGAFFLTGSFIVLVAADIIHTDPSSIHAPRWVLAAVGGVFMIAGMMVAIQGGFGPEGMESKFYLWLQFFFGMSLMCLFSSVSLWVGFGPGEREFTSRASLGPVSVSGSGNVSMGRIMFGAGGIIMVLFTIMMGVSQLKTIFKK